MYRVLVLTLFMLVYGMAGASEVSITKPHEFVFGSSIVNVKTELEPLCSSIIVDKVIPITAPLAKISQMQINCSGYMYGGKKRNIELVFQDDQLDIVWILFPAKERQEIINAFKASYGEPTFEIGFGTIFLQANAAIRNEPSEVLFASDRQVKVMLKQLTEQQAKEA